MGETFRMWFIWRVLAPLRKSLSEQGTRPSVTEVLSRNIFGFMWNFSKNINRFSAYSTNRPEFYGFNRGYKLVHCGWSRQAQYLIPGFSGVIIDTRICKSWIRNFERITNESWPQVNQTGKYICATTGISTTIVFLNSNN